MPLSSYLNSFKLRKKYWYTLGIDVLFIAVAGLLLLLFQQYIQSKSAVLGGATSPEQLQQRITSLGVEQLQVYLSQLQTFLLTFLLGVLILAIVIFLLYTLSQNMVWNILLQKSWDPKKYWHWNILNIILLPLIFVYIILATILRFGVGQLATFIFLVNSPAVNVIRQVFTLALGIILFLLLFVLYYSFSHSSRIGSAFADTISLLSKKWSSLWKLFLFVLGTFLILSFILSLLQPTLFTQPPWVSTLLELAVFLLYFSWLRYYFFHTIHDKSAA